MKKELFAFGFLILLFGALPGFCTEATDQTNSVPVIAIDNLDGNKSEIPDWQPAIGQGISEMLIESLESSSNKFQILEPTEAIDSSKESGSGESNSVSGGTKTNMTGSASSKKSARGSAGSSQKTETDDSAAAAKPAAVDTTGSDFTFCGNVTQFMTRTNASSIGDFLSTSRFANFGAKLFMAHIEIEWRLVDNATKKVVKRGITACSASGTEFDPAALTAGKTAATQSATNLAQTAASGKSGTKKSTFFSNLYDGLNKTASNTPSAGSDGASCGTVAKASKTPAKTGGEAAGNSNEAIEVIDYGNPVFMESALGKATCKAVTNLIEQLNAISFPKLSRIEKLKGGKILAVVDKDTIIVSLGSEEGLKTGDKVAVYQENDVKDDQGNVVFSDEKEVGEITLSSVQEERSRGSCTDITQLKQGMTVKAE